MKKLLSLMLLVSISTLLVAQPQGKRDKAPEQKGNPAEVFKAEKIAFITSEVGLTPEEAQVFWPLYNKIEEQQENLRSAERKASMELKKAMKTGEGNIDSLLDAYLDAHKANVNLHIANAKDYRKILSAEKAAKFFTSEEKFLRVQINRLRGDKGPGPRPEMGNGKEPGKGRPEGNAQDRGRQRQDFPED